MKDVDFVDVYDEVLTDNGISFRRRASDLPKSDGLTIMHSMGFDVPAHGVAKEMLSTLVRDMYENDLQKAKADPAYSHYEVVVMNDVKVHDPTALFKCHIEEAAEKYPDKYCMQYLYTKQPITYTMLKAGDRIWWYESKSDDGFRSNVGNVQQRVLDSYKFGQMQGIDESVFDSFKMPIVSVDFLATRSSKKIIAVDINSAPKIAGTPLEEFYVEIAESIFNFMNTKK